MLTWGRHIIGGFENPYFASLLDNPHNIKNNFLISAQVINEIHHRTWGQFGIILETPVESIFAVHHENMGLNNMFSAGRISSNQFLAYIELMDLNKRYGLPSPTEILQGTDDESINEVAVMGTLNGKSVRVSGLFIRSESEDVKLLVEKLAARYQLPIVDLNLEPTYRQSSR